MMMISRNRVMFSYYVVLVGIIWFCIIDNRTIVVHAKEEEEGNERCVNSNDKGGHEEEECHLADNGDSVNHDHGDTVEWIRKNGGFVDIRQDVRLNDVTNVNSGYGVFAKEDISKGELLLSVPWHLIIKSPWADVYATSNDIEEGSEYDYDDTEFGYDICGLIDNVAKEMKMGDQSFFAPYVRHLNLQPHGQIPEAYTPQAKQLLTHIKGNHFYMNYQDNYITNHITNSCHSFLDTNEEEDYEFMIHVAMLITQRTEDDLMIPYYEIYNHQNGLQLNTWMVKYWGQSIHMYARHDIPKGQEIYNSYNFCNNCSNRIESFDFGTMELFNDYGFIEKYPQRWILHPNFRFDLNYNQQNDKFELSLCPWCQETTTQEQTTIQQFLTTELQRLENIHTSFKHDKTIQDYPGILQHEWDLLWEFHQAFLVAITQGLHAIQETMQD